MLKNSKLKQANIKKNIGSNVLLIKGPTDKIISNKKTLYNKTGNEGMTVGGTGDVLSGIVGGLLAMGIDHFDAAVAGAFINGAAGDFVTLQKGYHMIPTDLLDWIPHVIDDPLSHGEVCLNQE